MLVTGEWVVDNVDKLNIIDCSWFLNMETGEVVPHREKGTRTHFDIDQIASKTQVCTTLGCREESFQLPHMLPSLSFFNEKMEHLGISSTDDVLLYDHFDGYFIASARVWWTLCVFRHKGKIFLLKGGAHNLPPLSDRVTSRATPATFVPYTEKNDTLVWNIEDMKRNVEGQTHLVLDARAWERFCGDGFEPRWHVGSGCIPGSFNLPWKRLFYSVEEKNPWNGSALCRYLKERDDLCRLIESVSTCSKDGVMVKREINLEEPIVVLCGSGVTACILALVFAHVFGKGDVAVYDGSWTEWALNPDTPKDNFAPCRLALSRETEV